MCPEYTKCWKRFFFSLYDRLCPYLKCQEHQKCGSMTTKRKSPKNGISPYTQHLSPTLCYFAGRLPYIISVSHSIFHMEVFVSICFVIDAINKAKVSTLSFQLDTMSNNKFQPDSNQNQRLISKFVLGWSMASYSELKSPPLMIVSLQAATGCGQKNLLQAKREICKQHAVNLQFVWSLSWYFNGA